MTSKDNSPALPAGEKPQFDFSGGKSPIDFSGGKPPIDFFGEKPRKKKAGKSKTYLLMGSNAIMSPLKPGEKRHRKEPDCIEVDERPPSTRARSVAPDTQSGANSRLGIDIDIDMGLEGSKWAPPQATAFPLSGNLDDGGPLNLDDSINPMKTDNQGPSGPQHDKISILTGLTEGAKTATANDKKCAKWQHQQKEKKTRDKVGR